MGIYVGNIELHSKRYGRFREWEEVLDVLSKEIEVEEELI